MTEMRAHRVTLLRRFVPTDAGEGPPELETQIGLRPGGGGVPLRLAPTGLRENAMFAVYGLAEASLAATFPPARRGLRSLSVARGELGVGDAVRFESGDDAVELVNLGAPVRGMQLRIADARGHASPGDVVGRVSIRGTT